MGISVSTFISTFIFSSALILILILLLKKKFLYTHLGTTFLLFFAVVVLIRLFFPVEFLNFTININSTQILPFIYSMLKFPVFYLFGLAITILDLLIVIWFMGTFFYNYRLLKIYRNINSILKLPETDEQMSIVLLHKLKNEQNIKKEIRIIQNQYIKVPAIAGIRKPTILLPKDYFDQDELNFIFQHELCHYKNHDNASKFILEILNSVYWWNPLFYMLKKQISIIFEFRADIDVIRQSPTKSAAYMESLLKAYKRQISEQSLLFAMEFSADNKKDLFKRFQYISNAKRRHKEHILYVLIVCILIFLSSFSFVFEPSYPLPNSMENGYQIQDSESAYLILDEKDNYILYINGMRIGEIKNLDDDEIKDLPIYDLGGSP